MSDEKRQPDVNNPADLAATSAGLNATRAERAADYANRAVGYVDARARDADRVSRWTVAVALSVAGVIIAAVIALTSQVFALAAEVDDLRNDVRQDIADAIEAFEQATIVEIEGGGRIPGRRRRQSDRRSAGRRRLMTPGRPPRVPSPLLCGVWGRDTRVNRIGRLLALGLGPRGSVPTR